MGTLSVSHRWRPGTKLQMPLSPAVTLQVPTHFMGADSRVWAWRERDEEESPENKLHQPLTSLLGSLLCPVVDALLFTSFSETVQISVEFLPNFFG